MDVGERKLPLRTFCDICEEFDLHETEDCPQQASDDLPACVMRPKENNAKKLPPERPYCDKCEGMKLHSFLISSQIPFFPVFGHSTEDCDEDQTFWNVYH